MLYCITLLTIPNTYASNEDGIQILADIPNLISMFDTECLLHFQLTSLAGHKEPYHYDSIEFRYRKHHFRVNLKAVEF